MKKVVNLCIGLLLAIGSAYAQNIDDYAKKADEIQKTIWNEKLPEFDVKAVEDKYANESAVIIARYISVEQTATANTRFSAKVLGSGGRHKRVSVLRERVKINDKVSLDEYATLEYQKRLDNSKHGFFYHRLDKTNTYVGVKLIKADGQERIIDTKEEVLTNKSARNQKSRLAIPGLQVGDIVDYYICQVEQLDASSGAHPLDDDYVFILADKYPVLSFNVNFKFDEDKRVLYSSANNAPQFTKNTDDKNNQLYTLKVTNLDKFTDKLWSAPMRQYPYVQLTTNTNNKFVDYLVGDNKDTLNNIEDKADRLKIAIKAYQTNFNVPESRIDYTPQKILTRFVGSAKELKDTPVDTVVKVLYDAWKFNAFCSYDGEDFDMSTERNERETYSLPAAMNMAHILHKLNVNFEVMIAAPRTAGTLNNFFTYKDVSAIIKVNLATPVYMAFNDVFTQFNEIPGDLQGEDAIVLKPQPNSITKFDEYMGKIPVIPADKNLMATELTVAQLPSDMQKLAIKRTVTETGLMRHNDQKQFVLPGDIDQTLQTLLNGDDLAKRVKGANGNKVSPEYDNAFEKAKEELPDNFKAEIATEYDAEPQQVDNCLVINNGLANGADGTFTFKGSFVMDGIVRTAGDNYLLEVGKLMGSYQKIEPSERNRKIDVYMPAARTLNYKINVLIPTGYQVKGIEDLARRVVNNCGQFSVDAHLNGKYITINITRTYNHNFEKAAAWPQMLEILDASYDFYTQKVLFQKL